MAKKNQTVKVHGYDSANRETEITVDQSFSDVSNGKHYGMPVTPEAFLKMIKRFKDQMQNPNPDNPFKDVLWVEFSKASLFRILSQEGCEYIRFYMAIPNGKTGKASLSLQGVDSEGKTINGVALSDIAAQMEDENWQEDPNKLVPPLEEKGNEGDSFQGDPVKSLEDFINKSDFTAPDSIDFGDFISKLNAYQQEKF